MHLQMASFQPWTVFRGKLIVGESFMQCASILNLIAFGFILVVTLIYFLSFLPFFFFSLRTSNICIIAQEKVHHLAND